MPPLNFPSFTHQNLDKRKHSYIDFDIYIYIYTHSQRERERDRGTYVCMYIYICMCTYIYVYIYEGLRPLPPAPNLEGSMIRGYCLPFGSILAVWSCLVPHFGSLGIPFGSILAGWSGRGPHVGGLGRYAGHGMEPELAPGTPEWAGLHSCLGGSIVLLGSRDPGNGPSGGWI